MKKMALMLVAVLGLSGATWADNGWGIFGSYWEPGDLDGAGGVGGKISFEIAPHALLDFRATWYENFEQSSGDTTASLEMMPFDVGFSLVAGTKPVDVYMMAGYSFFSIDGDVYSGGRKVDVDFDDENGFYAGAGLEVTLSDNPGVTGATRITFMVEGLYRYLEVDEVDVVGSSFVGDSLDGLGVNAGFMIRW
jgi:hypothetical protein